MLLLNLKTKMMLAVSSLIIIFMSLMSFCTLTYFETKFKETLSSQEFTMVSAMASGIDDKLQMAHHSLIETAKYATSDITNPEDAQLFLNERVGLLATFDNNIYLFSPSGRLIAEYPYLPNRRGLDYSHRDYIRQTVATGKPSIGAPYKSSHAHQHPAVMLTAPIFGDDGKMIAILGGSIDLMKENFVGNLSRTHIGQTGYLYLFTTDRTIIMHPDTNRILQQDIPIGVNKIFDEAINGFEGTAEAVNSRGVLTLATVKHLTATNWIIVANHPISEAFAPLIKAKQYFIWATLLGIMLVIILTSYLVTYFIAPLSQFTVHVEGLIRKEGAARLFNTNSSDEIGALSQSFNKMVLELDKQQETLRYLSWHDPLTDLFNRTFFELKMTGYRANPIVIGVIVCDVDGLKLINDTLGHDHGDMLLINAARVIKHALPANTTVARIGGDEFVALLPNSDTATLDQICQQIRTNIAMYNSHNPDLLLSISIGFAINKTEALESVTELFKKADDAMYREKLHRSSSTRSAIVKTLLKTLEARDIFTERHADRLMELITAFSREYGLSPNDITDLRLLAQFHDIGKVGIPDHILFKPGPLTAEEQTIMRRHSEIGHRIAQSSPELLPIAEWILKHHEWWNGHGYPLGLKGEEIPVQARILAVVDAYDAMTSGRPYRKSKSHEQALAELNKYAGSQFDPALVELFIHREWEIGSGE